MLFRFLEYSYKNEDDKFEQPHFIAGITIKERYDEFFSTMKKAIGMDIVVKDNWYTIDEIQFHYNGNEEDDLFCCDIYCFSY